MGGDFETDRCANALEKPPRSFVLQDDAHAMEDAPIGSRCIVFGL